MSKLLHCEWVLDNKLLWILFLTNPLMMLTLYGFISFHFALRFTINLQVRCALGNVVVFYLASRQQWLRKMLVSALSVVWTPWPTFLARWSLYIVHYTISYIGCGLDALIIIYCTLYNIIYWLWFGRPGRPQPTAWACDTGRRELYYANFDIAPFSRADHYIWYILIQYIFCQADSIYRTSFACLSLCRKPRR